MTVRQTFRQTIDEGKLLIPGDRVAAGISGGADSVCLLILLDELCRERGLELAAIHVNHGIRGAEADADERFVVELCRRRGIPCFCRYADVPSEAKKRYLTEEEAGRQIRYEIFSGIMREQGYNKLALAHHRDDLAETVLYNMARGTGLAGLASLRERRGEVIRPLLDLSREEIEAFLEAEGQTFCTDSTNLGDDHARNRIRHHILTVLKGEINERAAEHIASLSKDAAAAVAFIEREAARHLAACLIEEDGDVLITPAFFEEDPVILKEGLRQAVKKAGGSLKDITRTHIETLADLALGCAGRHADLPHLAADRTDAGLRLRSRGCDTGPTREGRKGAVEPANEVRKGTETALRIPGVTEGCGVRVTCEILEKVPASIPEKAYTKWLDYDRIKANPNLRTRRTGDRLVINAGGGTKSLSDYYTDRKIPRDERDVRPVIADGSLILWVIGERLSAHVKVTSQTKRVLMITAEQL